MTSKGILLWAFIRGRLGPLRKPLASVLLGLDHVEIFVELKVVTAKVNRHDQFLLVSHS